VEAPRGTTRVRAWSRGDRVVQGQRRVDLRHSGIREDFRSATDVPHWRRPFDHEPSIGAARRNHDLPAWRWSAVAHVRRISRHLRPAALTPMSVLANERWSWRAIYWLLAALAFIWLARSLAQALACANNRPFFSRGVGLRLHATVPSRQGCLVRRTGHRPTRTAPEPSRLSRLVALCSSRRSTRATATRRTRSAGPLRCERIVRSFRRAMDRDRVVGRCATSRSRRAACAGSRDVQRIWRYV